MFRQGVVGNFVGGASLNANVPIDVSGIIGRQVEQARIGEQIAEISLADARDDALADVYIAYVAALRAQQVALIDEGVEMRIEQLRTRAADAAPDVEPFLAIELATGAAAESLNTQMVVPVMFAPSSSS